MKYRLLTLLLFLATIISAQQTEDGSLFVDGSSAVRIPQSPEAGTLGRYGSLPLNYSTGQMNYSIPLHTITVDGTNWPINLNYNYGGLILEGKPSLAGLGWSLNPNGAVTREVRGLPDEHKRGYHSDIPVGSKKIKDLVYDYINGTGGLDNWSFDTLRSFLKGEFDSEVDKYTVNVGSLNFSFKVGLDKQPVYLSKHPNKVEIEWSQTVNGDSDGGNFTIDAFTVTDAKGIKYYFSQQEKRVPQTDEELLLHVITSWNLEYIEFINGQKIGFFYTADRYYDYSFYAQGAVSLRTVTATLDEGPTYLAPNYKDDVVNSTMDRLLLSSIVFPKGSIEFEFLQREGRKLYSGMKIKNILQEPINEFSFEYSGNRDFLDTIHRNNTIYYQFDYHKESPLPEFANASTHLEKYKMYPQDYWKFYNGKSGNLHALNIPNSTYSADKETSLSHTRLGALKRITYPTKGSTQIFYELNQIKTDNALDSEYYNSLEASRHLKLKFEGDYGDFNAPQVKEVSTTHTFDNPTLAFISHTYQGQRIGSHIQMTISRTDGQWANGYPTIETPLSLYNYYKEAPYLRDQIEQMGLSYNNDFPLMMPGLSVEFGPDDGDPGYYTETHNSGGKILFMPGTYTFKIKSNFNRQTDGTANISVQLYGPKNHTPPDFVNKDVGGIRVSKLMDCPSASNSGCVERIFDYNDDNGYSSGYLYTVPQKKVVHSWNYIYEHEPPQYVEAHTFLSNPFTVSDPALGTPVFYRSVIEKRIGSEGVGLVKNKFSIPFEDISDTYPKKPTGKDLSKSIQLESLVFEEGNTDPVSESITTYQSIKGLLNGQHLQDTTQNHPWSLKVYKKKNLEIDFTTNSYPAEPPPGSAEEAAVKSLYSVFPYKELDTWKRPLMVDSKKNGISTHTEYLYTDQYQLKEEKSIDSKGNEVRKENKYPSDLLSEFVFQEMERLNQLSSPVETNTFYNGSLVNKTKIEYELNAFGYKPSKTFSSKANLELEPKVAFTYDNKGRIIQADQLSIDPTDSNQSKILRSISYIWGYNDEFLLAKIENATYSQISSYVNNLKTKSNADNDRTVDTRDSNGNITYIGQEGSLRNDLNILRTNVPDAMVTTYTHDPLIGLTSITDPKGYTVYYTYDDFNRLKEVKDADGHLVNDYEYRLKGQTNQ